jgi:hypothetical protein
MRVSEVFRDGPPPLQEKQPHAVQTPPASPLALLSDRQQAKVKLCTEEVHAIMARATAGPLTSSTEAASLSELVARGKVAFKELESCRRSAVDPLNEQVRRINDLFRPLTWKLAELEERGKKLLLAWNVRERQRVVQEQEAARLQAEEAARKEAAALEQMAQAQTDEQRQEALALATKAADEQMAATVAAPMEAPRGIRTDTGTSSIREDWAFDVVRPELVPRCYCAVDEKLIRKAIREGAREIPGVAIYLKEGMSVRVGK